MAKVPLATPCACMRAVVERLSFEVRRQLCVITDRFISSSRWIITSFAYCPMAPSGLSLFAWCRHLIVSSSHRLIVVVSRRIAALFHHTTSLPHDPIIAPSHCPTISLWILREFTPDVFFVMQSHLCISDWLFINSWHCHAMMMN